MLRGAECRIARAAGAQLGLGRRSPLPSQARALGGWRWRWRRRAARDAARRGAVGRAPGRAGGSAGDDNAGGLRAGLPAGGTASSGEARRALR